MIWDSRGLWYFIPAALLVGSFFVDRPAGTGLKVAALVISVGITVALRRRDSGWGRWNSDADGRSQPRK